MLRTKITARELKDITGIPTKVEGLRLAKKFKIRVNSKLKQDEKKSDFLERLNDANYYFQKNRIIGYFIDPEIDKFNKGNLNELDIINNEEYYIYTASKKQYDYSLHLDYVDVLNIIRKLEPKINETIIISVVQKHYETETTVVPNGRQETTTEKIKQTVNFAFTNKVMDSVNNKKLIAYAVDDNRERPLKYRNKFTKEELKLGNDVSEYYHIVSNPFIKSIKIKRYLTTNKKNKREGAFFKYYLVNNEQNKLIASELEKIQIYMESENIIDKQNSDKNCLIYCLEYCNIDKKIIDQLKISMKGNTIPMCKLNEMFIKNKINLKLFIKNKILSFGDKTSKNIIKICLSDEHYYPYIDLNITEYALKNIDYLTYLTLSDKQKKIWYKISGHNIKNGIKYYRTDSRRTSIKSNNLVSTLLKENKSFIKPIKFSYESIKLNSYHKLTDKDIQLDNDLEMDLYKEIINKEVKKHGIHDIKVFFDFETITKGKHRTYMVCYRIYIDNKEVHNNCITDLDCELQFLNNVKDFIYKEYYKLKGNDQNFSDINKVFKTTLLAHNLTYDFSFLMKHGIRMNICERGSNLVCGGSFHYYGIRFNLKDTWALITEKLANFSNLFNFKDTEKEVMPYKLYNENTVTLNKVKISDALFYLEKDKHEQFLNNIKKWNLKDGKYFDHMEYSRIYCKLDIEIMCKGYFIFREWILKDLEGIDIDDYLTISSVSDSYFKSKGCYDGCYSLSGIARWFIQKCVIGGRCMTADNNPQLSKEEVNDFDGVSLYPSAMERLGLIGGFLKGKPKHIKNKTFDFLKQQDGYFIKVRFLINELNKKRSFPLLSSINKEGTRIFSNTIKDDFYYLDKISIEDLITFHKIKESDIQIIDGYYFNEGRNNKILETIRHVFDTRVKYKSEGNPIQNLYKLVMNSCYGKNIMKERPSKKVYLDSKEAMLKYVYRNYNHIQSEIIKIEGAKKYFVSVYNPIHNHYNSCHIGCEILSMSKRIMNEVMCLAEDIGAKIYYQDTDSMHIQNNKIEDLNKEYKKKYNRDLIGKKMGQFHNDFAEIKINGETIKASCATESIFLGKKSYIDKVKYIYGKDKIHYEYHIRMKSIPTGCIINHNKYTCPFDLYKDLYKGQTISFNLLKNGVAGFKNDKNGNIRTLTSFKRSVCFNKDKKCYNESVDIFFKD